MQGDEYSLASTSGLTYVAADWTALMRCCKAPPFLQIAKDALVAQLDRAFDYESKGREFESLRARHYLPIYSDGYQFLISVCSQKTSVLTQI